MVVLGLHKRSIHTILSIPGFIQAPVKVYHEGGLKEIHLCYTTMAASPEGLRTHKGPPPTLSEHTRAYILSPFHTGTFQWIDTGVGPHHNDLHSKLQCSRARINWLQIFHNNTWYSIFSKRVQGKQPSNSGNSLLVIKAQNGRIRNNTRVGRVMWPTEHAFGKFCDQIIFFWCRQAWNWSSNRTQWFIV